MPLQLIWVRDGSRIWRSLGLDIATDTYLSVTSLYIRNRLKNIFVTIIFYVMRSLHTFLKATISNQ
jgi:hypothetical protein